MTEIAKHLFVLTGPESTGKSTLGYWLAQRLSAPFVPEVARNYLSQQLTHPDNANTKSNETYTYGPDDLRAIAIQQQHAESAALTGDATVVVADTDQRVIQLWWAERFPDLPSDFHKAGVSEQLPVKRSYLLCYPDLVWEPDPLRENPNDRLRLFKQQLHKLEQDQARFRVIWGHGSMRNNRAWYYVNQVLAQSASVKN